MSNAASNTLLSNAFISRIAWNSTVILTTLIAAYLSSDGSSYIARNTGHNETLEEEYRGAPSVLKIKLMLESS